MWMALLLGAVNIRVFHNDNIPNVLVPVSLASQGNFELSEFTIVLERDGAGPAAKILGGLLDPADEVDELLPVASVAGA